MMETKRSFGVMIIVTLKMTIVIGIMLIGIMSIDKWALSNQEDAGSDIYEENCREIWCVKSIAVYNNSILIKLDTNSGCFQVVYRRAKDGTVIPLEYASTFSLKIGENIGWGDGDHAFASIVLEDIKDNTAFVIIREEHRPPATHQNLAYSKTRRCKIVGEYSPAPK